MIDLSCEHPTDGENILVAQDGCDRERAPAAGPFGKMAREHLGCGFVVRYIEDPFHLSWNDLKSSGETDRAQRRADHGMIEPLRQIKLLQRRYGGRRISVLNAAAEPRARQCRVALPHPLIAPALAVNNPGEIAFRNERACTACRERREHRGRHVRGAEHRGASPPEYAGLLAADALKVVAQPVAVVKAH